jgi:hypothetical protein
MATFWRVITFRGPAYEAVKADREGFSTALKVFIVVALIAALGQLLALQGIAQHISIYERLSTAAANLQARAEGRFVPDFIATPLRTAARWMGELAQVLEAGQPPLGKTLSQSLIVIGGWLESPFSALVLWLPAAVLLFVCAKLLRGAGSIREHVSLVLLAFAPQVLTVLGQFSLVTALRPVAGLLGVIAAFWSLAILIVAMMHAHGFSAGRSIGTLALAVLLVLGSDVVIALFWGALTALVIRLLS